MRTIAPAWHWALIDSPLGVAGVICGEGDTVRRVILPCPTADEARRHLATALSALSIAPGHSHGRPEEDSSRESDPSLDPAEWARENGPWTNEAAKQIAEYLNGERRAFTLPLDLGGTRGFTRDALNAAAQIPYGQTRSYWWVSVRAGNPRAMRAVGQAMATNPVPLIVPCHRVVRSDGSLGGFGGGGPEQKRQLLELESREFMAGE